MKLKSVYPCLSTCLERFMNCQWRRWSIFSFWLQVPLKVVEPLDSKALNGLKLSLSGDHQFSNAGLAVSLCKSWLQRTGNWEKLFQKVSFTNPSSHRYVLHKIIYQSSVRLLKSWILFLLFFFMDWTMLSSDNNNTQIDAWLTVCVHACILVSVCNLYVCVHILSQMVILVSFSLISIFFLEDLNGILFLCFSFWIHWFVSCQYPSVW